jgi:hypothetical protein
VRFAVAALEQVAGDRLRPGWIDCGRHAGEQSTGFDQLGAHHRGGLLLRQCRAGEQHKTHLAGADIVFFDCVFETDLAEQASEQGSVDAVGVRARVTQVQPE